MQPRRPPPPPPPGGHNLFDKVQGIQKDAFDFGQGTVRHVGGHLPDPADKGVNHALDAQKKALDFGQKTQRNALGHIFGHG